MLSLVSTHKCDAAFKKQVRMQSFEKLAAAGFTRYRKEDVDWPLHDGFHAWVGLNTGLYADHVSINPHVGIHVISIEKLFSLKDNYRYSRSISTYAVHIGELAKAGKECAFEFKPSDSDATIESEAERLAELLRTVGLDYARSIANYETLLPLLEERVGMLGGYPERVASCLYLMGRKSEARTFTQSYYEQEPSYFGSFAKPFLQKLSVEGF